MSRRFEVLGGKSEEPEITIKRLFGNVATPEEAIVVGFADTDHFNPIVKCAINNSLEHFATPEDLLLIEGIFRGEKPDGKNQTYKPHVSVNIRAEGWEDPSVLQRAIAASEELDRAERELSEMKARPTTKMEVYTKTISNNNARQELDSKVIFKRNDVLTDVIVEEVRPDRKLFFVVGKGHLRKDPEFAKRLERKLPQDTPYVVLEAEYNDTFKNRCFEESKRNGFENVTQEAKIIIAKKR